MNVFCSGFPRPERRPRHAPLDRRPRHGGRRQEGQEREEQTEGLAQDGGQHEYGQVRGDFFLVIRWSISYLINWPVVILTIHSKY